MSEIKIFDGTPHACQSLWWISVDEETYARVLGKEAHEYELARKAREPSDLWLLSLNDLVPEDKNLYRFKVTMEKLR